MDIQKTILNIKEHLENRGFENIEFRINFFEPKIKDDIIRMWEISIFINEELEFCTSKNSLEETLESLTKEVMEIDDILIEEEKERKYRDKVYWDKQLYANA